MGMERFMLFWSVVGQVWLLLQVVHCYRTKSAIGLSAAGFYVLLANSVIWFSYGFFYLKNKVVYASSAIGFILTVLILVAIHFSD